MPVPLTESVSSPLPLSLSSLSATVAATSHHDVKIAHDKETVIVFDWDDTLLCSSFLSSKGLRLDSDRSKHPDLDAPLRELETSVCAVLNLACSYGTVHIITNAETGWVQLSAQKFLPAVLPLLAKVSVISARSTYEAMFPDSPLKWKYYAFQERLSPTFNSGLKKEKNIVSFGDSHVEREAVRAVTRGYPQTKCKSVKFAERPSMEQLRRQIELVTNCFQYIHNHDGDLDLQLTVTVNQQNNNTNTNAADKMNINMPCIPTTNNPNTVQTH
jgi:hypothetical protein